MKSQCFYAMKNKYSYHLCEFFTFTQSTYNGTLYSYDYLSMFSPAFNNDIMQSEDEVVLPPESGAASASVKVGRKEKKEKDSPNRESTSTRRQKPEVSLKPSAKQKDIGK